MTFFVFHTILPLNSMKRVFSVRSLILAIIIVFSIEGTYAEEEFDQWIEAFNKEALKKNISQETFAASRSFMRIDERVLRLKNKQPEFKQTLSDYLEKRITPTRIQTGQHHLEENGPLLKALQRQYGVDPRVIVALWGLESNFGQYMGSYPIISSCFFE
jgi:membrane-bound lytic murein transglycosylase B